jgi:hypothetical protein
MPTTVHDPVLATYFIHQVSKSFREYFVDDRPIPPSEIRPKDLFLEKSTIYN